MSKLRIFWQKVIFFLSCKRFVIPAKYGHTRTTSAFFCSPQKLVPLIQASDPDEREETLAELFSLCRQMQEENWAQLKDFRYEHFAEACFRVHVADSRFVADLLGYVIGQCQPMSDLVTTASTTPLQLEDDEIESIVRRGIRPVPYLTYFLYHAAKARFTFRGYRLTEQKPNAGVQHPLTAVSVHERAKVVFQLLQYGASLEDTVNGRRMTTRLSGQRRVFPKLFVWLRRIHYDYFVFKFWEGEGDPVTPSLWESLQDSCFAFRLLVRSLAMPFIRSSDLDLLLAVYIAPPWNTNATDIKQIYSTLFPELAKGAREPRSLKHLCRCVIREKMNENWQLPFGVESLGLPEIIQDYVRLMRD